MCMFLRAGGRWGLWSKVRHLVYPDVPASKSSSDMLLCTVYIKYEVCFLVNISHKRVKSCRKSKNNCGNDFIKALTRDYDHPLAPSYKNYPSVFLLFRQVKYTGKIYAFRLKPFLY